MLYQHLKSLKSNEPQLRFYRYSGLTPPQQPYLAEPVSDALEEQASHPWATQLLSWVSSLFASGNPEYRPIGLGRIDNQRLRGEVQTPVYHSAPVIPAAVSQRTQASTSFPMLQGGFHNYRFAKIEEAIGLSRQQAATRPQNNPFRLT